MINCPKCGFHQPKDEFCASCGIDMYVYGAARKKQQRNKVAVFGGGFAVLLALVIGVALFKKPGSRDFSSQLGADESGNDSQRLLSARVKLAKLDSDVPNDEVETTRTRQPQVIPEQSESGPRAVTGEAVRSATVAVASQTGAGFVENQVAKKVLLAFLEMESSMVEQIAERSKSRLPLASGLVELAVHPSLEQHIAEIHANNPGKKFEALRRSERNIEFPSPITFEETAPGPAGIIGFKLFLRPTQPPDERVTTLDVLVGAYTSEEERDSLLHHTVLSIPKRESAWIRVRSLPRPSVSTELLKQAANFEVLKIFTRPEFKSGQRELFVIVLPK